MSVGGVAGTLCKVNMDNAAQFMTQHDFSMKLRMRINRYCMRKHEDPSLNEDVSDKVMAMLSPPLRRTCMAHIHAEAVKRNVLFATALKSRGEGAEEVISELCDLLRLRTYGPDEYIYGEDMVVDEMHFIREGRVQMEDWAEDDLLAVWTLSVPDSFGSYHLIFEVDSFIAAHSMTFVVAAILTRDDCAGVLKRYPSLVAPMRRQCIKELCGRMFRALTARFLH